MQQCASGARALRTKKKGGRGPRRRASREARPHLKGDKPVALCQRQRVEDGLEVRVAAQLVQVEPEVEVLLPALAEVVLVQHLHACEERGGRRARSARGAAARPPGPTRPALHTHVVDVALQLQGVAKLRRLRAGLAQARFDHPPDALLHDKAPLVRCQAVLFVADETLAPPERGRREAGRAEGADGREIGHGEPLRREQRQAALPARVATKPT